ncbi:hypothetical protein EZI54_06175 [Marinobacter halodurans]|uniref:Uncharacterized protein n=1 Tax=Marinobacter halodurans TaxID=2528979 RepID=A0ABY1ZMP5_9GAMM|nr:hypothetical protein [Marinobacter halodurans]TBW57625.1 hypothetical protein EZI54_06175 [Marinobacter halodurans]
MHLTLRLGDLTEFDYLSELLTRVLEADGYDVDIVKVSDVSPARLEWLLEQGMISVMMMGETASRNARFRAVRVAMTDNLMNQRILFIPKGQQDQYNQVKSLDDFRALGVVGGMGSSWLDYQIWLANKLPVIGMPGEWRRLYDMVAVGNRGIDYLPRGAQEMASEWREHPNLDVEQRLVLVYNKDHVLYISPRDEELYRTLNRLMPEASRTGLIHTLARKHYRAVFEPPINLAKRRVIALPELSVPQEQPLESLDLHALGDVFAHYFLFTSSTTAGGCEQRAKRDC